MGAIRVHWPAVANDDCEAIIDESDFDGTQMTMIGEVDAEGNLVQKDDHTMIVDEIRKMFDEDPDQENEPWWRKDGEPELKELRRRLPDLKISSEARDKAFEAYMNG